MCLCAVGESLASFVEDVRSFLFPEPKLVPPVGGVDRAVLMSRGPTFMVRQEHLTFEL